MGKHVVIKIINSLGQEIMTLTNNRFEAGHHTVSWDGKDNYGRRVASGIYYYQLIADDFLNIKKMILLR